MKKGCWYQCGIALLWVLFLTGLCSGAITTRFWTLNQSDTFRDGYDYGYVSIRADSSTGVVSFKVVVYETAYDILDPDFGIDAFGFNYQNITSLPSTWTLSLPTASWTQTVNQKLNGFGWFQVKEEYGSDIRFDPLEFSITLPTASEAVVDNFAVLGSGSVQGGGEEYFAAHIAGFQMTGVTAGKTSHWAAGKTVIVPEPMTIVLSLGGLALLSWFHKRR